jgi:hypothetical protein
MESDSSGLISHWSRFLLKTKPARYSSRTAVANETAYFSGINLSSFSAEKEVKMRLADNDR